MQQITLNQVKNFSGEVKILGSKSISNRALLMASLADGTTILNNLLFSDDTIVMLNALQKLGVKIEIFKAENKVKIHGNNGVFNCDDLMELNLNNAGTAMRSICAVLCLGKGGFILNGNARMCERPINDLVDALRENGAEIEYLKQENYPPLKINARGLNGQKIKINGSISSQFLTALLISSSYMKKDVTIEILNQLVSKSYIDITLKMMKQFGINVINNDYQSFKIKAGQKYQAIKNYLIEGDASSASYFLGAGAIGGMVKVVGINKNSIQGEIGFVKTLEQMGAKITYGKNFIIAEKRNLQAITQDLNYMPDTAMTVAILALFSNGTTHIKNIYNWQVKECNRLIAMQTELQKIGAKVEIGSDWIKIVPPVKFLPATIDTYDDHRMAMCFSLLAIKSKIKINDPDCTNKTFPKYFEYLNKISKY